MGTGFDLWPAVETVSDAVHYNSDGHLSVSDRVGLGSNMDRRMTHLNSFDQWLVKIDRN